MLPPILTTKTTPTTAATNATFPSSSSPSSVALPATSTSDNKNSPAPPAERKIRITSSYNYTKPVIRLNLKNLNFKIPAAAAAATSISSPTPPTQTDPINAQVSKVQVLSPSAPLHLPMLTPAAPDPPPASILSISTAPAPPPAVTSTSTANLSISPKTAQKVTNTIKGANSANGNNGSNSVNGNSGSNSSSNISLPPDYDSDLSDDFASTTDETDPDPDLHHRRRCQPQSQLPRSPSLPLPSPSPLPLPTKKQNQTQEVEVTSSSVDGDEDPFKELGLKPYSPIWLSSRTPSFELMRQRSYSSNPCHEMTTSPSKVHCDERNAVFCPNDKDDREIPGVDLREFLNEEADKFNEKDLTNVTGKERQESGSDHWYQRFGSIKKRSSPLLLDHYDDLENDDDDEGVNQQMVHAKLNGVSANKRPRRDHLQNHGQVPPPLPLPPNVNKEHDGTENDGGQGSSSYLWSGNSSGNHNHPRRHPPYGAQRFPPSQHHPHLRQQPYHHQHHSQQQDTFLNNNYPYSYHHHHHNHLNNRPYQPRPWTSYRGSKYHHAGGFYIHSREAFRPGYNDGEERSNWFHHGQSFFGHGERGRGRSRGGRGRGRSYGYAGYFGRYPFPPHQHGGDNGTDPYYRQQYQHHLEDEGSMTDHPLEIANGSLTRTGTVSGPSSSSPPPPPSHFPVPTTSKAPSRGHVIDAHLRPYSSSLSITSSPCTTTGTLHLSHNHNHHTRASAQQHNQELMALGVHPNKTHMSVSPSPISSATPSSTRTKTIDPLSKIITSTTTSLSYAFPSSFRTPSPPLQPTHHSPLSSRSLSRSRSRSRSGPQSPTSLEESAQMRLTRYASSETSSLAKKLATVQTLLLQAQKKIRLLTDTLRDLQARHQLVEQNYNLLLAKYRHEIGQ